MKRLGAALLFSLALSFSVFAQTDSELKTVELFSPPNSGNIPNLANVGKWCFNFITESRSCNKVSDIYYGNKPFSKEWNWFRASGEGTRNKIKSLGKKDWTDNFKVPVVKPYAKLKPGLRRDAFLSVSARRGSFSPSEGEANSGGSSRFNERKETFSDFKSSTNLPDLKSDSKPAGYFKNYSPFEKAVPGNMYVMRVVDENNDFYVLFRVDELEKGKRVKISWKRIEAPKED